METDLGLVDADMSWQDKANCRGVDTNIFYLEQGISKENDSKKVIYKELCGKCVVRKKCLSFAQVNQIEHGVWGGLTPRERKKHASRVRVRVGVRQEQSARTTAVA